MTPHSIPFELRNEFCGFVVSNPICHFRNETFKVVNNYKKVNSGGALYNNIGGQLYLKYPGGGSGDISKYHFFQNHKFTISFENSQASGYITEKVLHSKIAGCVPIYWGDKETDSDFVPNSFINLSTIENSNTVLDIIKKLPVKRILLPDTLGILSPNETFKYISSIIKKYPEMHFDFHAHNDYDLSVSNVIEGLKAGCQGLHLTVNGMGERAGNAPMASVAAVIRDFLPEIKINLKEKSLYKVSRLVSAFTGFRIPANKPIVGENVFTQTAGIHADGDSKKNLYYNDLLPERFGRKRKYALGKTSGKANIKKNLLELGLTLNNENIKKVTNRIIELGDKKEKVTAEDLPYIISDIINSEDFKKKVIIESYILNHKKGEKPSAKVEIKINGKRFLETGTGDGQFDAFINAIKTIYSKNKFILPDLIDYSVTIPPGSNSDALCETIITWKNDNKEFVTRGLDSDQTVSAIKSTEKMLNIISN